MVVQNGFCQLGVRNLMKCTTEHLLHSKLVTMHQYEWYDETIA